MIGVVVNFLDHDLNIEDLPFGDLGQSMNFMESMDKLGILDHKEDNKMFLKCTKDNFYDMCHVLLELGIGGIKRDTRFMSGIC